MSVLLAGFYAVTLSVACAIREIPYLTIDRQTNGQEVLNFEATMPIVSTTEPDTYMCTAHSLDEIGLGYVLRSTILANPELVHHVSIGACKEPMVDGVWNCALTNGTSCKGGAVNFAEWDGYSRKNGLQAFPDGVSLKVGAAATLKYLVTEVHYKNPVHDVKAPPVNVTLTFVKEPTKYNYQTYMMMTDGAIPPNKDKGYFAEMACPWKKPPVQAYKFYLHTHHHGYMAEAFLIRNKTWTLLGSQLSQNKTKNEFDIPGGPIEIRPGDILASRCFYINKGTSPVKFGNTDNEEMCNVDIYIGYNAEDEEHFRRSPACLTILPEFSFCNHPQTNGICF